MQISLNQLKTMLPAIKDAETWLVIINEFLEKYEINTPERIAMFFAQTGHESNDFNNLHENLNYSWQRLRQVFPRYFKTDAIAKEYHRKPVEIANRVYDDTLRTNKIGNTQPGDGYKFCGRGILQLTGRWNYTDFGKSVNMTAEQASDYLLTKRGAFESACWFWKSRNINRHSTDVRAASRAVNGGTIGLQDRAGRYRRCLAALEPQPEATRPLSVGSRGEDVKAIQRALNIAADGIYGNKTATRVKAWQRSRKLPATGSLTLDQVRMILA